MKRYCLILIAFVLCFVAYGATRQKSNVAHRDIEPANTALLEVSLPEKRIDSSPMVAVTPVPPARPTQIRIARPAPAARQEPIAMRGAIYSSFLSSYFPAISLPLAMSIVEDVCEQEKAITRDMASYQEGDGPEVDQALKGAVDMLMDVDKEARKQLAAIPDSTFDREAWKKLVRSNEYKARCRFPLENP